MSELRMVARTPGPALRPYVTDLVAYREEYPEPRARTEYPFPGAVLIIGLAAPMHVGGVPYTSFTGGLSDRASGTLVSGAAEGVEARLSPLGARRLFGVPMGELTNVILPAEDLLGPWFRTAAARLAETGSWERRLELAERMLTAHIHERPELGPQVPWAWAQLLGSAGGVSIASLAESLGWSHRHLVARFHDEVGLTPKTAARMIRFSRAMRLLRAGLPPALVAAEAGFYDQAHLNRDFRAFAGAPPGVVAAGFTAVPQPV
ncbi:helix-turn-helix domain-containing protein [Nonomuraea soli]|uniref:AraC-like DNA-binding protein n=1 Tax=Nonomuraea soli TaxID=1032476 RepID=A0A7W0CLQ9_9ACTN|nr:helix-turn-helix domain-containing protein [Nonomuraea soli]MBA2893445.1 AraC-like DNA-binding protein [Nonomuraea soli]